MPQTRRFLDLSSGTVERGSPRRGIRGEQRWRLRAAAVL